MTRIDMRIAFALFLSALLAPSLAFSQHNIDCKDPNISVSLQISCLESDIASAEARKTAFESDRSHPMADVEAWEQERQAQADEDAIINQHGDKDNYRERRAIYDSRISAACRNGTTSYNESVCRRLQEEKKTLFNTLYRQEMRLSTLQKVRDYQQQSSQEDPVDEGFASLQQRAERCTDEKIEELVKKRELGVTAEAIIKTLLETRIMDMNRAAGWESKEHRQDALDMNERYKPQMDELAEKARETPFQSERDAYVQTSKDLSAEMAGCIQSRAGCH